MAKWFRAHYNQEVRFSSAVKCKKRPQILISLLNQIRNYYYYCDVYSSAEEFLLSAGNCMCRSQLRSCLRDATTLHREFWEIPLNHPDEVRAVGCASKNRYRSILPNERSRVHLGDTEDSYINANYIRVSTVIFYFISLYHLYSKNLASHWFRQVA